MQIEAVSGGATHSKDSPKKIQEAGTQFEALLLSQMLRSVREASSLDGGDSASTPMMEMAEQQFAQLLASKGGLGIAHMVSDRLSHEATQKKTR